MNQGNSRFSVPYLDTRQLNLLIGLLFVIGIWLILQPYQGIRHDARLYTFQTLAYLHPENYLNDLFLKNGSQSTFTIFTYIHAYAIKWLGLNVSSILLLLIGQGLFIASLYTLFRVLTEYRIAIVAFFAALILADQYGGHHIFAYFENFLTPRLYSEAFTLFMIAALIHGRFITALFFFLLAAVFHPLIVLPILVIAGIYLTLIRRIYILIPLGGGILFILFAFIDIEPFSRLLQTMDPVWYKILSDRSLFLFATTWDKAYWGEIVFHLALLSLGVLVTKGIIRNLFISTVVGSVICIAIAIIGADYFHNVLIIQLQLWRVDWFALILSYLALVILFFELARRKGNYLFAVALLLILLTFSLVEALNPVVVVIAAFIIAAELMDKIHPLNKRTIHLIVISSALIILALIAQHVWDYFSFTVNDAAIYKKYYIYRFFRSPLTAAVISITLVFLWMRFFKNQKWLLLPIALIFTSYSIYNWDNRSRFTQYMEKNYGTEHPFNKYISNRDVVFWMNNSTSVWYLLRRSSYVSTMQAAGIVYSRKMAVEYQNKIDNVLPLSGRARIRPFHTKGRLNPHSGDVTADTIRNVCKKSPDLDFVVQNKGFDGLYLIKWEPVMHITTKDGTEKESRFSNNDYYLYDCNKLRSGQI